MCKTILNPGTVKIVQHIIFSDMNNLEFHTFVVSSPTKSVIWFIREKIHCEKKLLQNKKDRRS